MKNQIYKIKEFLRQLADPYYEVKKEQKARAERFSILERLAKEHGSIGAVLPEEFEREASITKDRDDLGKRNGLGNYISCTS